jgi:hypothetical protein
MAWIMLGNFSGGEVGMTPLTVFITISIQFALGSVIYLLTRRKIRINSLLLLLIYTLLYEIVFFFFTGNFALANISNEGFSGAIYRGYSISSLLSGLITMLLYYLIKIKHNTSD